MSIVVIGEKPDVAKAIATAISKRDGLKPSVKTGYIEVGEYNITWAYGHLLKLKEFESYNEEYKKWEMKHLPIYFDNWEHELDYSGNGFKVKQLKVIQGLLKNSQSCIHAGDPDDEGQYLIDEILQYYNYKKPVKRVLINDNNTDYVIKALSKLEDNKKYESLGKAAYGRAICDNIFGKNLTRFFTLKSGGSLVKVGRVQTPTLQLVINRDRSIENHTKQYYYTINLKGEKDGIEYKLTHSPKEKITNFNEIMELLKDLKQNSLVEIKVEKKKEVKKPPLVYNLAELQIEANNKYGYSPQQVLDITQGLREKYKAITYNRSDCRYLGEENFKDVPKIVDNLKSKLNVNYEIVNTTQKGEVFDDSKITAHHGIIPTISNFNYSSLTKQEKDIYDLIATRYLEQFCKPAEYEKTSVKSIVNELEFSGSSSKLLKLGYLEIRGKEDEKDGAFDSLKESDIKLNVIDFESQENETKPQARYTEATLIKDMVGISKYVENEEIKKLLKEKDKDKKDESGSIGTPATRASIIDNLIKSGYIEKKGKQLISTAIAREFCDKLPKEAKSIDNTAIWYQIQEDIKDGKLESKDLEHKVLEDIKKIMGDVSTFVLSSAKREIKGKELSPYLDPINNEPLYQAPTKNDPKKLWYSRANYDKDNPIGYMLSFDGNSLYELNSKKSYPIILNPNSDAPKPKTTKKTTTKGKTHKKK